MSERRSKEDPAPEPDPEPEAEPIPEPVPEPAPVPAAQNLEFERLPHETDAEFLARTAHMVPDSQSPSDIVPNRPNVTMGAPPVAVPAEEEEEDAPA